MGYKKKDKSKPKGKARISKEDVVRGRFSENFEKRVAPSMRPDKAQLVRDAYDYEYVNSLDKGELAELNKKLATIANQRIGIYLKSNIYPFTTEAMGTLTSDTIPTPAAFRELNENKGNIEKFDLGSFDAMSIQKLRENLATLRNFLASESSRISGYRRIMQERYQAMTRSIIKHMSNEDKREFTSMYKDEIMSESFQKLFWGIYNKLEEIIGGKGSWYERDTYMGMITKIMTIERNYAMDLTDTGSVALYLNERLRGLYEETEKEERKHKPSDTFSRRFNSGSK